MKEKPTESRGGVKGGSPLRGQGAELPCGVWGNAPTVPRQTYSKGTVNKGAGSEASLPVTLRVLRRAPPKLLFQHLCCVAPDGRDRTDGLATIAAFSRTQGFRLCGGDQRAMETDEVCDRPLETFGVVAPMFLDFFPRLKKPFYYLTFHAATILFNLNGILRRGKHHET